MTTIAYQGARKSARSGRTTGTGGLWQTIRQSVRDFGDDGALRLSAALAYYSLLALAPMLLLIVGIASLIWGRDAAAERLVSEMGSMVGKEGAAAAQMILEHRTEPGRGAIATVTGAVVLLIGASGVFLQLQDAMNTIWEVRVKPGGGLRSFIRNRLLSLGAVASIGFMLLVSLAFSAALSALHGYISGRFEALLWLIHILNVVVSIGLFTLLFAALFKCLPDVQVEWRDVWIGAAITAVLFVLGKFLIGVYLGRSSTASSYGSAGSIVVFAIWAYYASVILFFGAEFTQVFANRTGREILPAEYATRLRES